jgi:signal transduction histidine kinase
MHSPIRSQFTAEAEFPCQIPNIHTPANLASRLSIYPDLGRMLAALCEETCLALDSQSAVVFLFDETQKQFLPAGNYGIPLEEWVRIDELPLEIDAGLAEVQHTVSASRNTRFPDKLRMARWGKTWLALSGMVCQGRWIGALGILASQPQADPDKTGQSLLQAFANQAAMAIANVRFSQQIRNRAAELDHLAQVSSILRRARTLNEIVSQLVSQTVEVMRADCGTLVLYPNQVLLPAAIQTIPPPDSAWRPILADAARLQVLQNTQVYLSDGCTGDGSAIQSYALVLLKAMDAPLGALCIGYEHAHHFEVDEKRLLVAIAEMAGNAIQRTTVLDTLEQRVQVRTRELEVLYAIARITSQSINLDLIIEKCLEKVLEIFQVKTGMIHLLSDDKKNLNLSTSHGVPAQCLRALETVHLGNTIWDHVIAQNRPYISFNFLGEACLPHSPENQTSSVYVGSPIQAKGEMLGIISIFRGSLQEFSIEEIALLETIANQIGTAIDSAHLRLRSEETAILEERQRLARDLHDSVTQSLYSLSLLAEGYRKHAREAGPEELDSWFADLGSSAHQALKDMRLLLYELRPSSIEQDGIVMAINRRLEAVEGRSGLTARLKVDGNVRHLEKRESSELYHIIQEGLNNSLKHAHATMIEIHLTVQKDIILLEVADDGAGFDPARIQSEGMGLTNMLERARKLNGELVIHSAPGKGTKILFKREGKDEENHQSLDCR